MARSPEKMRGATDLANRFNLRFREESVLAQTAHKWLKVDLHWLHYGLPPSGNPQTTPKPIGPNEEYPASDETLELASRIEALSPHHRYLLEELAEQFYRAGVVVILSLLRFL
ncbi:putative transcriptional regulator [Candidatus Burkholderia pumila]|uniref:Transcriptional regulator n=1 Tax=Candidatus Burkholderia pumila TaxID=1090375 RepID=A0ABR5HLM9_9BURK|nr:putative transcriptional regulator [Candidatus Burkholderia pumila]